LLDKDTNAREQFRRGSTMHPSVSDCKATATIFSLGAGYAGRAPSLRYTLPVHRGLEHSLSPVVSTPVASITGSLEMPDSGGLQDRSFTVRGDDPSRKGGLPGTSRLHVRSLGVSGPLPESAFRMHLADLLDLELSQHLAYGISFEQDRRT
jgi:hypothetical protein